MKYYEQSRNRHNSSIDIYTGYSNQYELQELEQEIWEEVVRYQGPTGLKRAGILQKEDVVEFVQTLHTINQQSKHLRIRQGIIRLILTPQTYSEYAITRNCTFISARTGWDRLYVERTRHPLTFGPFGKKNTQLDIMFTNEWLTRKDRSRLSRYNKKMFTGHKILRVSMKKFMQITSFFEHINMIESEQTRQTALSWAGEAEELLFQS